MSCFPPLQYTILYCNVSPGILGGERAEDGGVGVEERVETGVHFPVGKDKTRRVKIGLKIKETQKGKE